MDEPAGSAVSRAVAGALALAAAMGIGRFAYTALLPASQAALGFGDAEGGALASANLVGYLTGVLAARSLAGGPRRAVALRVGLAITPVATALLALLPSLAAWAVLRFASGVASGLVFVLASAAALDARAGEAPRAGLLYAGVGAGIAVSGAAGALLAGAGWRTGWLLLAALAAGAVVPAWRRLAHAPRGAAPSAPSPEAPAAARPPPPVGPGRLAVSYFLEGLGYIVSGTFAVVAVRRTPGLEAFAPWAWALAGLAAAPSAVLWAALSRRTGLRAALALAFLVQAAGMALPSLSASAAAAAAGAVLFGGTFIGITTLTVAAARVAAPERLGQAVGTLTAVYGVGQILGPLAAGALARRLGDPRPAVLAAAVAVAAGAVVVAWPARRARPR